MQFWLFLTVILLVIVVAYLVVRVIALWSEMVQMRKFVAEAVLKSDLADWLSQKKEQ